MKTRSEPAAAAEARSWTWGDAAQVIEMGFLGPEELLIENELIWVLIGNEVLVGWLMRWRLGFLRRRELGEVVDMAMVVGFLGVEKADRSFSLSLISHFLCLEWVESSGFGSEEICNFGDSGGGEYM